MVLGKLDSHMEKNESKHFLTPYTKINSKQSKDLGIRPDTIKLLEENIGQTLSNINSNNIFSDPPLRILTTKTKVNKWTSLNLKFLHSKRNPKQHKKTTHGMGENLCK